MHVGSNLPVVLWQLPCGHINTTLEPSASGGSFPFLTNEYQHYEDSAPDFFLGDTFVPGTLPRLAAFSENKWNDPSVIVDGDEMEWKSHVEQASAEGASMMLFGRAGRSEHAQARGVMPTQRV